MYYRARYYAAGLGRFVQADTIVPGIENPQGLNRYSYVLNNPLIYTDPTGHFEDDALKEYLKGQYDAKWSFYWELWNQDKTWMDLLHTANGGDFLVSVALDQSSSTFSTSFFQFDGEGQTKLTGVRQIDRLGDGAKTIGMMELRSLYVGQSLTRGAALIQMADVGSVNVGAVIGTGTMANNHLVTQAEVDFENVAFGVLATWATGGLGKLLSLTIGGATSLVSARLNAAGDNQLEVGIYIPQDKLFTKPGVFNWAMSSMTIRYGNMLSKEDQLIYVPAVQGHCWGCE